MPTLFVFLLKVNAALLLFCAGYYLVLRHLTFYTLNRVYLMGAIVFATVYPQINMDAFFQRHQQLAEPVYVVVDNLHLPEKALAQPIYWTWLEIVFFAGVVLLAAKLALQLFSLYKVYRASQKEQIHGHEVRVVDGNGGPFSFWKSIYVNPTGYTEDDLRAILKHEQIHTDEWHTIDILLAELSVIFYWFNPGVWLMRKAVRENIEFITDRKILQQGADTKQYQYSLLNVSITNTKPGIANHFNISTLKKRILMMNARRSSNINLTRYAFLVPVLLVMLLIFSVSKAAIVKSGKVTYAALANSVNTLVKENPVSKAVETLFKDSMKTTVPAHRSRDTIKIIRVDKKDTMKIIGSNLTYEPAFKISIDTSKATRILNFITDSTGRKITRIRLNGREYHPDGDKTIFISERDSTINGVYYPKRDTIKYNGKVVIHDLPLAIHNIPNGKVVGGSNYPGFDTSGAKNRTVVGFNVVNKLTANALLKRMEGFSVNGDGTAVKNDDGKTMDLVGGPTKRLQEIVVTGRAMREADIGHVGDKLFIIDGVEATEKDLQKMTMSNVEYLSITKPGTEVAKKYGDKAKNGIVFITTKK